MIEDKKSLLLESVFSWLRRWNCAKNFLTGLALWQFYIMTVLLLSWTNLSRWDIKGVCFLCVTGLERTLQMIPISSQCSLRNYFSTLPFRWPFSISFLKNYIKYPLGARYWTLQPNLIFSDLEAYLRKWLCGLRDGQISGVSLEGLFCFVFFCFY